MTLCFGMTTILEGVDFALEEGDKLGIIGVNGSGKSSLFRVITGTYQPEEGSVAIPGGKTVGMLSQEGAFEQWCGSDTAVTADVPGENAGAPDSDRTDGRTVLEVMLHTNEEMLRMEARLAWLERALSDPESPYLSSLTAEYSDLHERFLRAGGLEYRARCASLLQRLGFVGDMQEQPVDTLSGGQRTRLALAVQLFREPDILMLDEPTNHLDIETTAWLENFLIGYRKTVLVISHDRYFLDRVTNKTLAVEHHRATLYRGGYTQSMQQRREDRMIAEKHWREQQKEIARQEAYIAQQRQWNRERNIIAAESRQKLLDKMEKLERPQNAPRPVRMKFTQELASGNDVLDVRHLSMAFGERQLFSDVSFLVKKKQRVLLIGPNGCGKSTMIKLILNQLEPTAGVIEAGYHVEVGYYDQENQNLTEENSVLEELWSAYPHLPEVEIRNTLAMFRFIGEDVFKPVSVLSGGERARLTLSKLILSHMNLLVLDEPTNHLDIDSREALESALEGFDGTIFVVSHDRYFIDKLATRILELKPGAPFAGDLLDFTVDRTGEGYDELLAYKAARAAESAGATVSPGKGAPVGGAPAPGAGKNGDDAGMTRSKEDYLRRREEQAQERRRRSRIEKLKKDCRTWEAELAEIEKELAGEAATDYQRLTVLDAAKTETEDRLLAAYEELEALEMADS